MEILSKLRPAEILLIRDGAQAGYKDLLKYTLIDLLVKKVLKTVEHEHQAHPNDPIQTINYLSTGLNFKTYNHKAYERVFLSPFLENSDLDIMFRHLIKIGFENAGSRKKFVFDRLLSNTQIGDCFKVGPLNRFFESTLLTSKGKATKIQVEVALTKLEKDLPVLLKTNPEEAMQILHKINGNVFLLASFDFELLKNMDDIFTRELQKRREDTEFGCAGCFIYFDTYSEPFYGGFDSTGGGASGCSGDSGCGGCGGCGS